MGISRSEPKNASAVDDGFADSTPRDGESRQEYVTRNIQALQRAIVTDDSDKAFLFVVLLKTMREYGAYYDEYRSIHG